MASSARNANPGQHVPYPVTYIVFYVYPVLSPMAGKAVSTTIPPTSDGPCQMRALCFSLSCH